MSKINEQFLKILENNDYRLMDKQTDRRIISLGFFTNDVKVIKDFRTESTVGNFLDNINKELYKIKEPLSEENFKKTKGLKIPSEELENLPFYFMLKKMSDLLELENRNNPDIENIEIWN